MNATDDPAKTGEALTAQDTLERAAMQGHPVLPRSLPMTANESTPSKGDETSGMDDTTLSMLDDLLQRERASVVESVEKMRDSLRDGEKPTENELTDLRVAAEGLQYVVEEHATEIADGDASSRRAERGTEPEIETVD